MLFRSNNTGQEYQYLESHRFVPGPDENANNFDLTQVTINVQKLDDAGNPEKLANMILQAGRESMFGHTDDYKTFTFYLGTDAGKEKNWTVQLKEFINGTQFNDTAEKGVHNITLVPYYNTTDTSTFGSDSVLVSFGQNHYDNKNNFSDNNIKYLRTSDSFNSFVNGHLNDHCKWESLSVLSWRHRRQSSE